MHNQEPSSAGGNWIERAIQAHLDQNTVLNHTYYKPAQQLTDLLKRDYSAHDIFTAKPKKEDS